MPPYAQDQLQYYPICQSAKGDGRFPTTLQHFKEHLQFVCGSLHSALTFRSTMLRQSFAPDDTRETSAKNVCSVMFRLLSALKKQTKRNLLYR